jgi:hypothetical protein
MSAICVGRGLLGPLIHGTAGPFPRGGGPPFAHRYRAGLAPASAETDPGIGGPVDADASLRSDPELIPEAAE